MYNGNSTALNNNSAPEAEPLGAAGGAPAPPAPTIGQVPSAKLSASEQVTKAAQENDDR